MSVVVRGFGPRRRREAAHARVAALFDEHAQMVLAICRHLLRDPQAAEDAAQETFLSALWDRTTASTSSNSSLVASHENARCVSLGSLLAAS
jgi:DNA-directed RNA polymerase specialized sigma24 family protein